MISAARREVDALHVDPKLVAYAVDLVRATRDPDTVGLGDLRGLFGTARPRERRSRS
jgi:hypothetical protein